MRRLLGLGPRRRADIAWQTTQPDPWVRVRRGLMAFGAVIAVGISGYLVLGLTLGDAIYMTVITISTVGYREIGQPEQIDGAYRAFTALLLVAGVGTTLYTLSVLLETLLESQLTDHLRRRRMDREIDAMSDHIIVCGYGRLGRTIACRLAAANRPVVVIDTEDEALEGCPHPHLHGDATDDDILRSAGIERAGTLIAVADSDAANLYVTLSARTLRPDLFIVARVKLESAEAKLLQAGADRVVNPHLIGGERIAALTLQPHVSEFLDVVMHDEGIEFRLSEISVDPSSWLAGQTLGEAHLRDRTGAMVLAIREPGGAFMTNPPVTSTIAGGSMLIAIGTSDQLEALTAAALAGSAS
jgi:voltage-gated potassium channel